MKKNLLLCLIASTLLASCGPTSQSDISSPDDSTPPSNLSSSEEVVEINYYATINSYNDVVYLYGIVGETFDLSLIDTRRCFDGKAKYQTSSDGIEVNGDILTFKEKGIYQIEAYFDGLLQYTIQLSVNDSENERYAYPSNIDLNNYILQSGEQSLVTSTTNTLTLQSTQAWSRVTYQLDERYNKNYTIECDVSFLNSTDPSRWFGLIFSDKETSSSKYPYYQFDFRQNTALNNSVEVTYIHAKDSYSYPYIGNWGATNPGILDTNQKVHMKLSLIDSLAKCSLSTGEYETSFETLLPTMNSGNFGFQCAGATVLIENVSITLNESTKISSTAIESESIVNVNENVDGLKPNMIASSSSYEGIYGVHADTQQFFARVDGLNLYSICDELMDINLNEAFLEFKGIFIPNLQVEDEESLQNVIEVCKSFGIIDLVIWSSNVELLDLARNYIPYARMGYIPTNISSFETYDEVGSVCREGGKHGANLIMIDHELLSKESVIKATSIGYTIVANAKNGENYSVIDSALDGCKLILANYSKNVLNQTNTIYDPSVFNVDLKYSSVSAQTHSLLSIPIATGHRGAGDTSTSPSEFPENTIESFKYAYDNGANAVEIDVHETKDKQLAVIHDDSTGAYSNQNLVVKSSTMDELKALKLKNKSGQLTNYYIPSLNELFDVLNSDPKYSNKSMVIEVKDNLANTGIKAIEIAKEKGWYNRITMITFGLDAAKKIHEYDPAVQVSYLNTIYRRDNEEFWGSVNSYLSQGVGLSSQWSTISKEAFQESNARGYMYWLWTYNTIQQDTIMQNIVDGNRAYTTNFIHFFTANKYKLIADSNLTLAKNSSMNLSATSVTYDGTTKLENDVEIIVLSDNATANGNSITRTSDGDIYAVIKHKTEWKLYASSTNFYIYSDLVVIH